MSEKRLFISEEHAKRQKRLKRIPSNVAQLEVLWITHIVPLVKSAESILALASTSRFFNELYALQPNVFWNQLCQKHSESLRSFSPKINYKHVFISATLIRCIACHGGKKLKLWPDYGLIKMAYLHKGCIHPYPIVSPSKAMKDYHVPKNIIQKLTNMRPWSTSRYLLADVQDAAYAYYGSKEKWEEKNKKVLNQRKVAERKKARNRFAKAKKEINRFVLDLGPEFEFSEWQYPGFTESNFVGSSEKVKILIRKELKYRFRVVIAKSKKTYPGLIGKKEILPWLLCHPRILSYFNEYSLLFNDR